MKREPHSPPKIERLATTVPEAGKALGLGKSASYEAARRGDIPTVRIGKRLLVPLAALKRMLEVTPGTLTETEASATSKPKVESGCGHGRSS